MNAILRNIVALFLLSYAVVLNGATVTLEKSLSITKTSWMKKGMYSYASKNPANWFEMENQIIIDYDLNMVSGGVILQVAPSTLFVLFSGSPTVSSVLNSGIGPRGLFDFGGSSYSQFLDTNTGSVLDSASTGTGLGNLPVRINQLNDPSYNLLEQENLAVALAHKRGRSILAFQVGYGFANDKEEFYGSSEEVQELWKSQLRFNFGFKVNKISDFIDFFDLGVEFKSFGLKNSYNGQVSTSAEKINLLIESAGAFEIEIMSRLGLEVSRSNYWMFFGSIKAFDYSSTAKGASSIQPFITNTVDNYSRNGFEFKFGVSDKVQINQSVSFLIGTELNYRYNTLFYDGKDNGNALFALQPLSGNFYSIKMPVILAFEAQISTHWVFNISLVQNIVNIPEGNDNLVQEKIELYRSNQAIDRITTLETSSSIVQGKSNTEMSLGLSWKIATIRIDWLAQLEIFREGPYFISGENRSFATSFGVSYNFSSLRKKLLSVD